MYENQYPDVYHQKNEKEEQEAKLNYPQGRFSSENNNNDPNANSSQSNSYYNNSNANSNANTNSMNNNASYGYANTNGTWQSRTNYNQNTGSYQYGSVYSNEVKNDYTVKQKKEKKKGKTGSGYFKKVLVSVSLGLFFGICAGLGLYAVEAATGMLNGNSSQSVVSTLENSETTGESAKGNEAVLSDSVSYGNSNGTVEQTQVQAVTTVVSDVSDVVSAVMPAAVSISNTYTETMSYFGQSFSNQAEASGSGIIVGENDTELLIVSNYHVIEGADVLSVQFVDGSEAEASIKGSDADMDLAVIAVPLEKIPSSTRNQIAIATLGDSDSLKIGEPAIAIGNSLGYGQSVTTGVISALDRELTLSDGSTGTFIQTDAAINPGNSGGALLNIKGEVIGINSNKIGGSVVEGMGYAIPISAANPIIAELMLRETRSKVAEDERGFLGISGISVTDDVSSVYGMPKGVYIAQVYDGTAAASAGLKKGDILTKFDGASVSSMDDLQRLLEYYAKGDTVELTIMSVTNNGYQDKTVTITLGDRVEQ